MSPTSFRRSIVAPRDIPGMREATDLALILSPSDPMPTARAFVRARHSLGDVRTLHYWRGGFYAWTGSRYADLDVETVRAELWNFLEAAFTWSDKTKKAEPFRPSSRKVSDALDALRAVCNLPAAIQAPAWLRPHDMLATDLLACRNGLLHLPSLKL